MGSQHTPDRVKSSGRRRHSRLRARLSAKLMTLTDNYTVTLFDLSFFGARVAIDGYVRPGGEAVLCWASFEAFARVAWCHGSYCGLEFDEPLPGQVLIDTRDLYDATPRVDPCRVAARAFVNGVWV